MSASKRPCVSWPAAAICCVSLFMSSPVSAYVACNQSDCWQTDAKVKWPGETFMFHEDSWWNEHRDDHRYRMHGAVPEHDPKRGFWADGEWHTG